MEEHTQEDRHSRPWDQAQVDYMGEDWTVQYLSFKVKGAKKIEIYVEDQKAISVCCSIPSSLHSTSLNAQFHACSLINGTYLHLL